MSVVTNSPIVLLSMAFKVPCKAMSMPANAASAMNSSLMWLPPPDLDHGLSMG